MQGNRIAINATIMDRYKAGIGNYAFNLLQGLTKLSIEFQIDVYIQEHMSSYFDSTHGIQFISCPNFTSSGRRIMYEQLMLPSIYKSNQYSMVHFLDYMSPVLPIMAKKVVTIHDLSYYIYPQFFTTGSRLIKQILTKPSLRSADRIISVSQNTCNDIKRLFNITDKLEVIHLGVDTKKAYNAINDKTILDKYDINSSYIMYAGTLEPRKNVETLIRAYSIAVKKGNIKEKLVLCGKAGWKYKGIYDEIENTGIKDNIIITGYVPDNELSELFSNAKAFIYPSIYEGFGLPPLEAMLHNIPVICSNVSSLPEIVGDAALTFPPKDYNKLADLIIAVLKDESLSLDLKGKGYKRASAFTWEKTAKQTLRVYEDVLSKG